MSSANFSHGDYLHPTECGGRYINRPTKLSQDSHLKNTWSSTNIWESFSIYVATFFQRWSDLFSHSSEETLRLQSWVAIVGIWICEGSYLRACSRKELQMEWQHGFHGSKTFRWDSHLPLRSPIWSASSFVKVLLRAQSHGHQCKMLNAQLYIGIPFNIIKLKGLDCDKRTQWKCFI